MDEHHPLAAEFVADLARMVFSRNGRLDIADRATDLDQHEVLVGIGEDEVLDRVGDVGNHLHRWR